MLARNYLEKLIHHVDLVQCLLITQDCCSGIMLKAMGHWKITLSHKLEGSREDY